MLLLAGFDFPLELKSYWAFRETGPAGKLFYVLFVGFVFKIKVSIILKMLKCKIGLRARNGPVKAFRETGGGENELRRNCASDWVRVYI